MKSGNFIELFRRLGLADADSVGKAANRWARDSAYSMTGEAPAVVRHGTVSPVDFKSFDPKKAGAHTNATDSMGFAGFVTPDHVLSDDYARYRSGPWARDGFGPHSRVIQGFVRTENPLVYDFKGADYNAKLMKELSRAAQAPEYDSMLIKNINDGITFHREGGSDVIAFKDPRQFKGLFNRKFTNNPDYMRAAAPVVGGAGLLGALAAGDAEAAQPGAYAKSVDQPLEPAWNPVESLAMGIPGGLLAALGSLAADGALEGIMSAPQPVTDGEDAWEAWK